MRVGRYLPGLTPERYRALAAYDRRCILESLDVLLARENGEKPPGEEDDDVPAEIEAEAERARKNFEDDQD